ncbi:MAG: hypothetical protein WC365_07090 [Candidatus Babeliales bacterium]|jgi:hypothetical protein
MTTNLLAKSDVQLAHILWDYHYLGHRPQPADIILGLGSNEIRVAHYCVELYNNKIAPRIIFSGYQGNASLSLMT